MKIFNLLNSLSNTKRWNSCYYSKEESVLEHSGFVAIYSLKLAMKHNVLTSDLLAKALLHDIDEAITGDVITPTKYHNLSMSEEFQKVEEYSAMKISEDYFDGKVYDLWKSSKDLDTIEGSIVKLSDHAAVVYKIWQEFINGNKGFLTYIPNIRAALEHNIEIFHYDLYDDTKELLNFIEEIR